MQQLPKRLISIDVLRAVTMLLMIFVNDAEGLKHIPSWIGHADEIPDKMGFADTIFPAFLFIVGLSLPFAIKNKIKAGQSFPHILAYILIRSAALLLIGFYHVNLEEFNNQAALISRPLWAIAITIAFFMIWLDYPQTFHQFKKYALITGGFVILLVMALLYKGGDAAHPIGMHPSWWGILGIIGWAYLVCAFIYLVSQGKLFVLIPVLGIFITLNICLHAHILNGWLPVIGDASSCTLVMGGIVISEVYATLVTKQKTWLLWPILTISGLLAIVGGFWVRPFAGGISKIHSTPAWTLICTGITILMFQLLIYLVDVKGKKDWFKWISAAGTSTLTCYLIPYFQYFILKLFHIHYPAVINYGIVGLLRSVATAFLIVILVKWMETRHLRLKL